MKAWSWPVGPDAIRMPRLTVRLQLSGGSREEDRFGKFGNPLLHACHAFPVRPPHFFGRDGQMNKSKSKPPLSAGADHLAIFG